MQRLKAIDKEMLASPDQQISLTDPDSRSMATSGRGSGVVGYNVQVAVDTEHHLIVTHEVTNTGSDRSQLAKVASQAKDILGADHLDAVADRGYFNSPEILACEQADITVTLPKPMTSGAKSDGRFGKQDFVYLPTEDVYRCPAGEKLAYRYTNEEDGKTLRRYWTTACPRCPLKSRCTTGSVVKVIKPSLSPVPLCHIVVRSRWRVWAQSAKLATTVILAFFRSLQVRAKSPNASKQATVEAYSGIPAPWIDHAAIDFRYQ
jgi:Transposase DDE domain